MYFLILNILHLICTEECPKLTCSYSGRELCFTPKNFSLKREKTNFYDDYTQLNEVLSSVEYPLTTLKDNLMENIAEQTPLIQSLAYFVIGWAFFPNFRTGDAPPESLEYFKLHEKLGAVSHGPTARCLVEMYLLQEKNISAALQVALCCDIERTRQREVPADYVRLLFITDQGKTIPDRAHIRREDFTTKKQLSPFTYSYLQSNYGMTSDGIAKGDHMMTLYLKNSEKQLNQISPIEVIFRWRNFWLTPQERKLYRPKAAESQSAPTKSSRVKFVTPTD